MRIQVVLPGATRTEIWERSGRDPAKLDPARTMNADELVDAALAELPRESADAAVAYGFGGGIGLDAGEWPRLAAGSQETLVAGGVLALHAVTRTDGRLTCAGETIRVDATGATVL